MLSNRPPTIIATIDETVEVLGTTDREVVIDGGRVVGSKFQLGRAG